MTEVVTDRAQQTAIDTAEWSVSALVKVVQPGLGHCRHRSTVDRCLPTATGVTKLEQACSTQLSIVGNVEGFVTVLINTFLLVSENGINTQNYHCLKKIIVAIIAIA